MTAMQAALLREFGSLEVAEVPVPEPGAGEVLVRVGACGICGTDLKIVAGAYRGTWPPALPFIIGHEWSGEVAALGHRDLGHLQAAELPQQRRFHGGHRCSSPGPSASQISRARRTTWSATASAISSARPAVASSGRPYQPVSATWWKSRITG